MSSHSPGGNSLETFIRIGVDYQRSVSVESASSVARVVEGYIPTERALDMITRIISATEREPKVRSWSVTGPYGSGKSSFLALCQALLGPRETAQFREALQRVRHVAPVLAAEVETARVRAGADDKGYFLALAAAGKEPANRVIVRALLGAVEARWSGRGRKPVLVGELRELAKASRPKAPDIMRLFAEMELYGPVLLAIDEFGKVLEYAAEDLSGGDLYVLQLLAEHVNSSDESASCLLTLQHLAISDYTQSVDGAQRKEWSKVQGRFQEVAFANSSDQAVAFVRGHFDRCDVSESFNVALSEWAAIAKSQGGKTEETFLQAICADAESTYPLHPLVVAIAPALSQRFSQGDRSLHAWLASDEPFSVSRFLGDQKFTSGSLLPVYGPDSLFDYFLNSPAGHVRPSTPDGKVTEILDRVGEAKNASQLEMFLLKTIGLLNLVGPRVALRSSAQLVTFAARLQGYSDGAAVEHALSQLQDQGFVVYREHAREFRIWQGTDVDIDACVARARERLAGVDLSDELNRVAPAGVRVAQRHGHTRGTFRYFKAVYGSRDLLDHASPAAAEEADGLMLLSFTDGRDRAVPPSRLDDARPVVVCESPDRKFIARRLAETVALAEALLDDQVAADPVARREMRERLAEASDALNIALRHAFDPRRSDLQWFALGSRVEVSGMKGLSSLLSDVCDAAFASSVPLHNEILNRVQLSSQGAKARRALLAHMLESPHEEAFGIAGFGPERSMYESVFRAFAVHGEVAPGEWELREPTSGGLAPVWSEIERFMESTVVRRRTLGELQDVLLRPPFGVREPVLPTVLLPYLAIHSDDVALYQDGSFEPELTAPLMERLIKAPDRFSVRKIGGSGLRELVATKLVQRFGRQSRPTLARNSSLLDALRPIFATVRGLSEYGLYTSSVSAGARAVRSAVGSAHELDELLFVDLPVALQLQPISADRQQDDATADQFVEALGGALEELSGSYDALLSGVEVRISQLFNVRPGAQIRPNLRERARRLEGQVIDRRLGAFIAYAMALHLDDRTWLEAVCMSLSDKSAATWRDADREIFDVRLRELAGLFARVEHLCSAVDSDAGSQGFIARRIGVTHPDGIERSRVVWANEREVEELRREVEGLKERLSAAGGTSDRIAAFLVLLADDVLMGADASTAEKPTSSGTEGGGVGRRIRR